MFNKPNGKRVRNLFDPVSKAPFKFSRSRLENFTRCPRCFYLDLRLGVGQPPGYPFNLNSAVDHLLKKEFDVHRAKKTPHPLMKSYGVDAIPFAHNDLDKWRHNFTGVQYLHAPTNLFVTGAVDDVWQNPKKELIVVDYKSTSKDSEVTLDADWQDGYKRQMEIYQWLLRRNGFAVSNVGYFVYCNGKRDAEAFDAKLEFSIKLLPYEGDDAWVEGALHDAKKCLLGELPKWSDGCEYCAYRKAAQELETSSPAKIFKSKKITQSAKLF